MANRNADQLMRHDVSQGEHTTCRRCKKPVIRVTGYKGAIQCESNGEMHWCDAVTTRYLTNGAQSSVCRGDECRARIFWALSPDTGKRVPVDPDGGSHFQTCIEPNRFSGATRRAEP